MTDINLVPVVCPGCGASLTMLAASDKEFCKYCGTTIRMPTSDRSHKAACSICVGAGRLDKCPACNGSGKCSWFTDSIGHRVGELFLMGYKATCQSGKCSACGGSGRYKLGACPGCRGTGQCPRCKGTGSCTECHGNGKVPNPKGAEKCKACGGTGTMGPRVTKPHEQFGSLSPPSRCPACGGKWPKDLVLCPTCGYAKRICPRCGEAWPPGAMTCRKCGFGGFEEGY